VALVRADRFEHYATADIDDARTSKGVTTGSPATFAIGAYGPSSGPGMRISGNYSAYATYDSGGASGTTWIYEFDFRISSRHQRRTWSPASLMAT
jgi:hypothetical protein